ncbi:MAG: hypothetical protein LBP35_05460 [Candidatus Ancillula trichonymphae]|nr:hypothetical protein [Candidatus Ancillula trichonymphae]
MTITQAEDPQTTSAVDLGTFKNAPQKVPLTIGDYERSLRKTAHIERDKWIPVCSSAGQANCKNGENSTPDLRADFELCEFTTTPNSSTARLKNFKTKLDHNLSIADIYGQNFALLDCDQSLPLVHNWCARWLQHN